MPLRPNKQERDADNPFWEARDAARPLPARVSCTKDAAAHRLTDLVRYVLPASPAAITVPAWQRRLLRMTAMRVRADC
jgi:hypothetical protein